MKKHAGYEQIEIFSDHCDQCGKKMGYLVDEIEPGSDLTFNFGYGSPLDGFDQKIELCVHCLEKTFLELHKKISREAQQEYYDHLDKWWEYRREEHEGELLISKDMEEIA